MTDLARRTGGPTAAWATARRGRRRLTAIAGFVATVALVSGGCGSSASPSAGASSSGGPTGGPSTPASASPTAGASPAAGDPAHVAVSVRVVVDGLSSPLFATGAGDGSGRLFVLEQGGRVRVVRDGRLIDRAFLDLSEDVSSGGERGLLGLAFAPGFGTGDERRFYVDYTDRDGNTVVAEYRASASDPDVADPGSARAILRVDQPYANHNGGMLAFGPDRMLYVGLGDGGSGGDPHGNGQNLGTLLGKILRIDVLSGSGSAAPYAIPPDNPFVGRDGARGEIWAYGLRNPWRFSFDRAIGDLWIGDVGQGRYEEVDQAPAGTPGRNYGWNRMEGRHCYPSGDSCDTSGLTLPVAEYGHDRGCSISGGYVARGASAGPLAGVYVFSDYCSGTMWGLASGGPATRTPAVLADTGRSISSFGEDDAGNLYATDIGGGALLALESAAR